MSLLFLSLQAVCESLFYHKTSCLNCRYAFLTHANETSHLYNPDRILRRSVSVLNLLCTGIIRRQSLSFHSRFRFPQSLSGSSDTAPFYYKYRIIGRQHMILSPFFTSVTAICTICGVSNPFCSNSRTASCTVSNVTAVITMRTCGFFFKMI